MRVYQFVGSRGESAGQFFIWPHTDRLERCGAQATPPVQDSIWPHPCIWSLRCWDCGGYCCQQNRSVLHSGQHSQPGRIHKTQHRELSWDPHKSVCLAHQEATAARLWQRCHQAAGLNKLLLTFHKTIFLVPLLAPSPEWNDLANHAQRHPFQSQKEQAWYFHFNLAERELTTSALFSKWPKLKIASDSYNQKNCLFKKNDF